MHRLHQGWRRKKSHSKVWRSLFSVTALHKRKPHSHIRQNCTVFNRRSLCASHQLCALDHHQCGKLINLNTACNRDDVRLWKDKNKSLNNISLAATLSSVTIGPVKIPWFEYTSYEPRQNTHVINGTVSFYLQHNYLEWHMTVMKEQVKGFWASCSRTLTGRRQ